MPVFGPSQWFYDYFPYRFYTDPTGDYCVYYPSNILIRAVLKIEEFHSNINSPVFRGEYPVTWRV